MSSILSQRHIKVKSRHILKQSQDINSLLSNLHPLISLIQAPDLVANFIRNGYYEDAIHLNAHISRLALSAPNIYADISFKSNSSITGIMRRQLLNLLVGNVKLPACIRMIGYLKRINVYSQVSLRILFLNQRNLFLESLYSQLPSDPFAHIKGHLEISREHFFDLISQYNTIFSSQLIDHDPFIFVSKSESSVTVLSSFITSSISRLEDMLRQNVPLLKDTTQINSVLSQLMYFGLSLGRIGIDLRLIPDVFEDSVFNIVESIISKALLVFESRLDQLANCKIQVDEHLGLIVGSSVPPPNVLLGYPPLAILYNSYLIAFNQLRVIAMLDIAKRVATLVHTSLKRVADCLVDYFSKIDDASKIGYRHVCFVFGTVVVAGIEDCVCLVFKIDENWDAGIRRIVDSKMILDRLKVINSG